MSIPIFNAKDRALAANTGTMPNLEEAIYDWFQPMTFVVVSKSVDGFQDVEIGTEIDFRGIWQPAGPQTLQMKPEGQRLWKWFDLIAQIGVPLDPDYVVSYLGVQYRVMTKDDYKLNSYIHYTLVEDFTGSGPSV